LDSHSLPDYPLHSGQTYAELVLQEFSYSSQTSVAQMVYIIDKTYSLYQPQ